MTKEKKEKVAAPKASWIKLTLELLVVFIGVSAGFLFDSYREDRSDRKLEEQYLQSLYDNILADSAEIQLMIRRDQDNMDISRQAVSSMQEGTYMNDSAVAILSIMATYNFLNLEDASYESIVNSGNLGLIRDFGIREKIVYYYRNYDDMRFVEQVYYDYITNYILPFVTTNLDFIKGEFVDGFRVDDIAFRNMTSGYYVLSSQKMEMVQLLDSLNNDLRIALETVIR